MWKRKYSVGLAALYPLKISLELILKELVLEGAKTAVENGLNNVAFIRTPK